MKCYFLAGCGIAVAIVNAAPAMAQQKTVKIGFISSFSDQSQRSATTCATRSNSA